MAGHLGVMRAVRKYTRCRWILLYVRTQQAALINNRRSRRSGRETWLTAPMQQEDGTLVPRTMGTPQGGVASPLLANIFLHLAFDDWMRSTHPDVPFERYADDIVAHCRTETQAQQVLSHIKRRLAQCRLDVHPEKTHIVYCKDDDRPGQYPTEQFTFLGYTFRSRRSKNRWGKYFINFAPAVSNAAATRMRQALRRRHLPRRSDTRRPSTTWPACGILSFEGGFNTTAAAIGTSLGARQGHRRPFYKSALYPVFRHFNGLLVRWAMRKYKRLRRHRRRASHWLGGLARREPRLFAHWHLLGVTPAAG